MNFNIFQRRKAHKYSVLQLITEPSWSRRDYVSFAEEGYVKNVIAFRAINMIANAASSVPLILYQLTNQEKSQLKIYNAPHKLDQKKLVNPSKKGKEWSVV